jgi:TRAP-type uncharacterized transport system substrate-binding protein
MVRLGFCKVALVLLGLALSTLPSRDVTAQQGETVNRGVVEIETSGSAGIALRMVEDLANLVDDGATRRVLPVVGKGALQMLTDLKYLRGIDMVIVPIDVLEYARQQRLYPGIETFVTYITKLHNEEFHLLARPEIKDISELKDRRVNIGLRGSGTSITASRLFEMLKAPVTVTNDPEEIALDKLRKGEIAALAFVAGKPAPLFSSNRREDGFHFLAIPVNEATASAYIPTLLSAEDYPGLIPQDQPVGTVAVGDVLAVADLRQLSERSRNVANFVEIFFTGFESLLEPGHHPKWNEVNLAAEVPGWRRYAPAQQWLQRNIQVANTLSPEKLRAMFSRFVDERRQAIGGAAMTQQDKDALFQQFESWQRSQQR